MIFDEKYTTLPFDSVRNDTFSTEVIRFCGENLWTMLPLVRPKITSTGDYATLGMLQRALCGEELSNLESFVWLAKLFLTGFGPSRLDEPDQLYLGDLMKAVERHLKLACRIGILVDSRVEVLA